MPEYAIYRLFDLLLKHSRRLVRHTMRQRQRHNLRCQRLKTVPHHRRNVDPLAINLGGWYQLPKFSRHGNFILSRQRIFFAQLCRIDVAGCRCLWPSAAKRFTVRATPGKDLCLVQKYVARFGSVVRATLGNPPANRLFVLVDYLAHFRRRFIPVRAHLNPAFANALRRLP